MKDWRLWQLLVFWIFPAFILCLAVIADGGEPFCTVYRAIEGSVFKGPDPLSDSVVWSDQSLRTISGADYDIISRPISFCPRHWFLAATDFIARLNHTVDRGLTAHNTSKYSFICLTYCQKFCPSNVCLPGSFFFVFSIFLNHYSLCL